MKTFTILLVFYVGYQLTKHICFSEQRVLSDMEHLEPVLKARLESGIMLTHSWDNTVESYLAHHPDCCSVSKNTFFYSSFFDSDVMVTIDYELSESEKRKKYNGNATRHLYIYLEDPCGKYVMRTGERY